MLTWEQRLRKREWAFANRDKVREANRRWRAANPTKVREQTKKRMQRLRQRRSTKRV